MKITTYAPEREERERVWKQLIQVRKNKFVASEILWREWDLRLERALRMEYLLLLRVQIETCITPFKCACVTLIVTGWGCSCHFQRTSLGCILSRLPLLFLPPISRATHYNKWTQKFFHIRIRLINYTIKYLCTHPK